MGAEVSTVSVNWIDGRGAARGRDAARLGEKSINGLIAFETLKLFTAWIARFNGFRPTLGPRMWVLDRMSVIGPVGDPGMHTPPLDRALGVVLQAQVFDFCISAGAAWL